MKEQLNTIIEQNDRMYRLIDSIVRGLHCPCRMRDSLPCPKLETDTDAVQRQDYDERQLITIKDAERILNVCRWTVDNLRSQGKLTTIKRNGRVRLLKSEVEQAYKWYSIPQGKV